MMGGRTNSSYPFTASQLQELEHQALIFKYMASGIPIPPDLILPIRRSLLIDSPAHPYLPYASTRWGAYQMGYGRKVEDPEPGRCKRTDGKKWRCSKDACPDSKYCERHLHRGKSRSRKHVELSLATSSTTSYSHSSSTNFSPLSLPALPPENHNFLFPWPSSGPLPLGVFQHQDNSTNFHYRNFFGPKEDVHEYPFFESQVSTSGKAEMRSAEELKQLREHKQSTDSDSHFGLSDNEEKEHHYFMLGDSVKPEKAVKLGSDESQSARPFHCFIDEWPQTQLSIAMPNCDVPATASQCFNDG